MTGFVLKIIACVAMFVDHASYAIYGGTTWQNVIGRLAFPIYAFMIAEGYTHTKSLTKYFLRLGIFAILSQYPFFLLMKMAGIVPPNRLNIFFTLVLGLLAITVYDKSPSKLVGIIGACISATLAEFLHTDYGAWGVVMIFAFYALKDRKPLMCAVYAALIILKYISRVEYLAAYAVALVLILLYNGERGRNIKYLMYVYYPAHIMLLYMVNLLIAR